MRVRPHVTTILFLAAAVGVSIYAYLDRGSITDPERAQRTHNVFPAFRRDDLTRIEIVRGSETLTLEREDEGDAGGPTWRMLSPFAAKVDPAAADTFVAALDYAGFVRRLDGSGIAFDPVRAKGTLRMGRVTYRFTLGGPAAGGPEGAAYLRLDGEGTMVVTRDLTNALLAPVETLRDKTVVPYLSIDLSKLEVRGPSDRWIMQRIDDVSFRFTDSGRRVSRDGVDKVWRAFAELRAESFLDEKTGAELTQKPTFTLVMTPTDGTKPAGELVVGDECPGHPDDVAVVRRAPEPMAVCAPKGVLAGFGTARSDLDDARLFVARPDEVETLRLESVPQGGAPGPVIDIARKGTGWHERAPVDRDLDADEARLTTAWVAAVTKVEGKVDDHPPHTFTPHVKATLTRADGHVEELVEIAPLDLGRAAARRKSDGMFVELAREPARLVSIRTNALKGPIVFQPSAEGAWASGVTVHCPGVDEDLVRGDHGFTFTRPAGLPADTSSVLDLADVLLRARADRWVADFDDGTFGFGSCSVAVTVRGDGGARKLGILLGDPVNDAAGGSFVYAHTDADPAVFTLPAGLLEMTKTVMADRNVFFRDRTTVERVTILARGHAPLLLHREGETLVPAKGTTFDAGADAGVAPGEAVLDVLTHLRAATVEHLGPARLEEALAPPDLDLRVESAADGGTPPAGDREARRFLHAVIGAATPDKKRRFARVEGVDATYSISSELLAPLFALR